MAVSPAVALAQLTIAQCEPLLQLDEDGIDEGSSSEEWRSWLGRKSEGLSKGEKIRRLQDKVQLGPS